MTRRGRFVCAFLVGLCQPALAFGQTAPTMSVEDYTPRSTLVVPATDLRRARYPFIDVHNHQFDLRSRADVDSLVAAMDRLGLQVLVNLSGGSGRELERVVRLMKGTAPTRFAVFANLDFRGFGDAGWTDRAVAQLRADVSAGAQGLKIFKDLGLEVRDAQGRRVQVDDVRLAPIWELCGQLGIPVLIHSGEPRSHFEPIDRFNERWLELKLRPGRARPPDRFPTFAQVMAEQRNVFRRHPRTTFIAAHLAWSGNDLASLGAMLDSLPNVHTEIGAVGAELGRQPRTARDWMIRYQDRVMMGKDIWAPEEYFVYFRLLETADEYFEWFRRYHGGWRLYGLELPDSVLKKVYYRNALRVIPGLDRQSFP